MKVAIVADSTSDIDAELAKRFEIDVVPLFVNFGERRYRDSVDLSHHDFYAMLASEKELPTTSQPTSAMFEDAFRPHVEAGTPIVCVTIMASLSGTLNAAQAAAAQFPDAEIHLVDSGTVSAGLALQAVHAATLAQAGQTAAQIVSALARDYESLRGYATIPDLSHAVRTGRVSRTQAFIGSLVKIVPVLRIDSGKVAQEARVRTFARAQDTMIDSAVAALGTGDGAYIGVIHTNASDLARSIFERVRAKLTGTPQFETIIEGGPVIATHAGAGACGLFVLPRP
jgi:DegV family protein with EDD domain